MNLWMKTSWQIQRLSIPTAVVRRRFCFSGRRGACQLILPLPSGTITWRLAGWAQFMNFALQGGVFAYYPDSSQPIFTNYWLEDTNWTAAYKAAGQYSF